MWPALLILIGVGPLIWAAVPRPRTVGDLLPKALTLPILLPTLTGVIWALSMGMVSEASEVVRQVRTTLLVLSLLTVAAGWVMLLRRSEVWGRLVAGLAGVVVLLAASHVLHDVLTARGVGDRPSPKTLAMTVQTLYCLLVSLGTGAIPVLLICAAQGWTKASGRLWPWVAAVTAAPVVLGALACWAIGFGNGVPVWALGWCGVAGLTLGLLGGSRGMSARGKWNRARQLMLLAWPNAIATAALGTRVLMSGQIPW